MLSFRTLPIVVSCVALAVVGFGHPAGQDALELAQPTYAVGDAVHSTYHSSSSLHTVVFAEGKLVTEFDSVEVKSGTKTVRVLAVDERGIARVRIEYGVLKAVQQRVAASGVDDVDERNPLQGRAFTLQRRGESFRVLDEKDARVPDGLARLVLEEEGVDGDLYLLAGDRIARELAGKSLPIGVEISLSKAAARVFVGGGEDVGDLHFVVTPKGTREEDGQRVNTFAARCSIQRTGIGGEPDTAVELRGELRFEASTGRFLSIQLDGLVTLESVTTVEARTVEVTGQGPWSIQESSRYERPR